MLIAIQVVWWIGLVGALLLTLVILKEVSLVLRTIRDIDRLVRRTHEAARNLGAHLGRGKLDRLAPPTRALEERSAELARTAAALEAKLRDLTTVSSKPKH